MNFRTITRRLAAGLAALLILCAPAEAESFSAIVTAKSMKVYADEACTWNVGALAQTAVVTVESYENGVARITQGDREGYAAVRDMAAISAIATPAEVNVNTYVFQKPSLSSRTLKVKKGTAVNLLATNGAWAMVERSGVVAYMNKAHLTVSAEAEPDAPAAPETPSVVTETFPAEVVASGMRVYKSASTASACLGSVKKGTTVTVQAYNSAGWAYIELNGRKGFAKIADMKRIAAGEPAPTPAPTPAPEDYIHNDSYSVEKRCFLFLTREMKLNTAAACGILANIERECSFNVNDASYDGGYGLVQWTGSRNTKLKNWCKENGYDYKTLEGQLWFLKYELETSQVKTYNYLKNVADTPAGAYDAAYYFCYYFEIPVNKAAQSVTRGNLAKDKYWVRYSG